MVRATNKDLRFLKQRIKTLFKNHLKECPGLILIQKKVPLNCSIGTITIAHTIPKIVLEANYNTMQGILHAIIDSTIIVAAMSFGPNPYVFLYASFAQIDVDKTQAQICVNLVLGKMPQNKKLC